MKIVIVTCIPSPYQVELFDKAVKEKDSPLYVIYTSRCDRKRNWLESELGHPALFLDQEGSASGRFARWLHTAELVVFSEYGARVVRNAMRKRKLSGRPWCFWGERPGYRRLGGLGQAYRTVRLQALHRSRAPIWGIGQWAIEGYRREFGDKRRYFNVPYFSDLARFRSAVTGKANAKVTRFLFSGSLIRRKGVHLLARAFVQLARDYPDVTLDVLGTGPLHSALEELCAPVRGRATFHGFVDWQDLPTFYARADVLCVPSRYDGWGMIVPEGLASGLPVIATNRMGAARDLVKNGENGWIVRAGDLAALYGAMRQAAHLSAEDYMRMRAVAMETAESHSLEVGVRRFLAAAEETMAVWTSGTGV